MTHAESTQKTKEMLSSSLKKFLAKKSLGKITVSEIITDCNVNRKTFYYHFEDIYALLKWTLEQEAIDVVKQFDLTTNLDDAILFVMSYIEKNAHVLSCVFDSIGRSELKRFFYYDFYEIVNNIILECEEKHGIHLEKSDEAFLCNFFLEGIIGMVIDSFSNQANNDKNHILKNIRGLMKALPGILSSISESSEEK